jgi:flagellar hook-basal body complex protein FliE
MSQMEIDSVLAQIRSISAQTRLGAAPATAAPDKSGPSEFASLLAKGIDQVNQTQQRAGELSSAFQRGEPGVELPQVMLEMQKANVSFRALTEVRNRLVSAYQEIMNMQL